MSVVRFIDGLAIEQLRAVHIVVIKLRIAIEEQLPITFAGYANLVIFCSTFAELEDDHDVITNAVFLPTMHRQDLLRVADVRNMNVLTG